MGPGPDSPDNRRVLVAAALSFLVLVLWQQLFMKPAPKRAAPPDAGSAPAAAPAAAPPPAAGAPTPNAPEELARLETPEFTATFSTWGGGLKSFVLKEPKFQRDVGGVAEPVDLVRLAPGQPYPLALAASPELGGAGDLAADPGARTAMRIASQDARDVVFEGRVGAVGVRKRYQIGDRPYELKGEVRLFGAERSGAVSLVVTGFLPPHEAPRCSLLTGGAVFESMAAMCRAGDRTVRFAGKEALERVPGTANWVGVDHQYFAAALIPDEPRGECLFARGAVPGAALSALRLPVERGESAIAFRLFAGPKRVDLLRAYGRDLDTAIDYGSITNFFAFFARILLWIMRWFHDLVRNWGAAIILLTLTVKVLLYPLTVKQMRSMNEMRKLQPEIDKLKAKFGADKEKLNQAVMRLYQQHKVNPLGGCLPMVVQLPIWFALYATLQTSVELYREPFLWIRDLTQHDPVYVLPLLMGVTMFITQKMSPQPADNAQAKMMLYFLPIFFTVIMLQLPAGLTLYIFVNNLLSIAQQQYLTKRQAAPPARA